MIPAYTIGVIPGDGIGPELVESAIAVLDAACAGRVRLDYRYEDGGAGAYARTGAALADDALARIRESYDAVLKGPVGLPEVRKPDGTEAGVLGGILRTGLDAYANVRPVRLLPGVRGALDGGTPIDYVIVRENTEGLYASRGLGVGNAHAMTDQMLMTRPGVERVVRYAFELARTRGGAPADGVRRVTCVDKSNVLRGYAFFRQIFDEVATAYPDIDPDHRYADAAGHDLVADPAHFDVLVMENFLGDVLSDVGAATVGGLGMCPSGNIGAEAAYFEPVHGSAPALAGRDEANPTSQILTAALLLRHLGEAEVARSIEDAVAASYATGAVRLTGRGTPEGGLRGVTAAVVAGLG
ncbi:MAG TPA: isocitrate/isopropylmalate family dehydrogenase [Streptosporangiaceae bacterium]|jgi:3-isopropylmalate dehydrogenase